MDLSQAIREKQSRKLPEGSAQPHSFPGASPGPLGQQSSSFPRFWDKLLKITEDFILPQPFSMSRQTPSGFFV